MTKDDQYTFELRPTPDRSTFVAMKRGGLAHQVYISELKDVLEGRFGVLRERVDAIYNLARSGCAIRYYMEEGKIVALFDSEKWHIDSQ